MIRELTTREFLSDSKAAPVLAMEGDGTVESCAVKACPWTRGLFVHTVTMSAPLGRVSYTFTEGKDKIVVRHAPVKVKKGKAKKKTSKK